MSLTAGKLAGILKLKTDRRAGQSILPVKRFVTNVSLRPWSTCWTESIYEINNPFNRHRFFFFLNRCTRSQMAKPYSMYDGRGLHQMCSFNFPGHMPL